MARNLAAVDLTDEQWAEVDAALETLERVLGGMVSLSVRDRRHLAKMGPRSEPFCRQTLLTLTENPQIVPPNLDVAGATGKLRTFVQFRPRIHRISRFTERMQDTEMALRADIMEVATAGYAVLKVAGRTMGLDGVRHDIGSRFARSKKRRAAPEASDPPSTGTDEGPGDT